MRLRPFLPLALIALAAATSPDALAAPDAGVLLPVPRTLQLANGMRVALAPDSSATTVDVALWFPAGTRYERAGQSGLTHLFDALLFAGTLRHPAGEHHRLVQREGGEVTAFSTPDFACAEDNAPPGALPLLLELEADRMAHLSLTARDLEAARLAVRREYQNSPERSPLGRSLRRLYEVAFAGHPYRRPVLGNSTDVEHVTLPVVQAWWRDHYGPSGTWLTVAGRFDPDSAEALVRRTLGAVPRRGVARTEPAPLAPQTAERHAAGAVEAQVPLMLVGWRTPPQGAADAPALQVLDRLLTRGSRSRLDRALVSDTSACLATESALDLRKDGGLFYVAALMRPGADSTQAEREVLDAIERGVHEAVAGADLEGAIKKTELETLFGWQTSQGISRSLGTSASVEGNPNGDARSFERVRELTPASVRETAERTFDPSRRTVVWMHPTSPGPAPARPHRPAAVPAHRKGGR